jgi:DNA-binding transcriptional ArsR family regulator
MSTRHREDVTRIFRALSVQNRLEIVRLLAERTLCVGALSNLLGISAGAVSQHLRVLRDAGLVQPDRRGYFIHYSLAPGAAEHCRAVLQSLFGSKKGAGGCAAERRSAKGPRSSRAHPRAVRRSK